MLDVIRSNAQSFVIKIAFAIIIIVFCFWGVGSFTGGPATEILSVNGQSLGIQELNQKIGEIEERLRRQRPDLGTEELRKLGIKRQAAQELLVDALLTQEAERMGLVVTPIELRQTIENIPAFQNEQGKFDPELYKTRLNGQHGDTPGSFEKRLARDLLRYKVQMAVTAGAGVSEAEAKNIFMYGNELRRLEYAFFPKTDFVNGSKPSDDAVRAWYDSHQQDFKIPATADISYLLIGTDSLAGAFAPDEAAVAAYYEKNKTRFTQPEEVRARHILVLAPQNPAAGSDEEKKAREAEKTINDIHAKLLASADFAELAKQYSEDPGSAQLGGELGWFERGRMVPEFSDAAFSLNPGEISKPFKTTYGYHIVQTEEKRPSGVRPLDDVRKEITYQLGAEEAAAKLQDTLDQILLAVMGGKDLAAAGAPYKLTPENPGPLSAAELTARLGLKAEEAATLLATPAGTVRDTPLVTKRGYVLARVNATKPEAIRPFDEVKSGIEEQLAAENQVRMATEAAQAALQKKTKEGDIPGVTLHESQPVSRQDQIDELGSCDEMLRAAFMTDKGAWAPKAYTVGNGAALVRVKDILPADEALWEQMKGPLIQALSNAHKQETLNTFFADLQSKAKILVKNEKILED